MSQKKSVISKKHGHNCSENPSEREKVGVFWKFQLICCRIGTKPFKIGGKMAKKKELEVGNPPLKMG